ncbi:MAG: hypothetical protein OSA99_05220 [Acidimicrobiales bacterium]|nr:hypothetical protein [Acidimicrobiales bacterium]
MSSVLLLEFNELSPRLMDRFIAEGHLPNFERLRSESATAITDPDESQDGLEPWIQWVTVHTGVARSDHRIEKLGEADRLTHTTIGQVVASAGGAVWLCGSMNLPARAAGDGRYLPDPWNPVCVPHPSSLRTYADFVRQNVQEHSNDSARMGLRQVASFAVHQIRHGLSRRTVRAVVTQLVAERRGRRGAWARASVLDRFQWDVFRWYWRHDKPRFASFFSNSTAHYQHVYWRNLEPDAFLHQPTAEQQRAYGDAILHGYRQMDVIIGEAFDLVEGTDTTLMLCTALSQQPYLQAEATGGKFVYRPNRFDTVIDALGIRMVEQVAPVMAEQFHLLFADEAAADAAATLLRGAAVDGRPAFAVRVVGTDVFTGCCIHDEVAPNAMLVGVGGAETPFHSLFYRSESAKSGYHHPDGIWWTRTGQRRDIAERVSLRSVAPTVLGLLDLEIPSSMTAAPVELSDPADGADR